VLTSSGDGTIRYWNPNTGSEIKRFDLSGKPQPTRLVLTADTKSLYGLCSDDHVRRLDAATGELLAEWPVPDTFTSGGMDVWPATKTLILGGRNGTVRGYDLAENKLSFTLSGHLGIVKQTTFSPDGTVIAALGGNKMIRLWKTGTHENTIDLKNPKSDIVTFAFLPDGKRLLAVAADRSLQLFDTYTGEVVRKFETAPAPIRALAVSGTGKHAVTVGANLHGSTGKKVAADAVVLWDLETGGMVGSWSNPESEVKGVVISPDGHWAVVRTDNFLRKLNLAEKLRK
jgi:WD40 repeat protein